MQETYLAHSEKGGFEAQSYQAHVTAVTDNAARYAAEAEEYSPTFNGELKCITTNASLMHDFGKLCEKNQAALHKPDGKGKLPINHVDAGCAELTREGAWCSALVVYSHHRGLPDMADECNRCEKIFRDSSLDVRKKVDKSLPELFQLHKSLCPDKIPVPEPKVNVNPMFLRMALSCLADADHSDTAAVYGGAVNEKDVPLLRAEERLEALDRYVDSIKGDDERSRLRQKMYNVCRNAATDAKFFVCDGPVGSGKTTAVMAHLLQQAISSKSRRIFVVLPYTNIIQQSVSVYRKALTLPGENPEEVVAELHYRADFEDEESRYLTSLWRAPIIVTTAVAFFETLASSKPSALRRLHELPGSVILLDEAHCMLPVKFLPLAWKWMNVLADDWGCRWTLASGSLVRYWELNSFSELKLPKPEITELTDEKVRQSLAKYERGRIKFRYKEHPLDRNELIELVQKSEGPRLLIVNTVQNAAVIAEDICNRYGRQYVEHLSTALTPKDREAEVKRIIERLSDKKDTDWTLVATSCVEAGMDFSFRTGFREISSLLSLLQASGRVNRNGDFGAAEMWSFSLADDKMLTENKGFQYSAKVLSKYLAKDMISPEISTRSLEDEIIAEGGVTLEEIKKFLKLECKEMAFCTLNEKFKPIEDDRVMAVVDNALACDIERGCGDPHQLQMHSVSIPRYQKEEWGLVEIIPGIYRWTLGYDHFLGYIRGVIDDNRDK